MAVRFTEAFPGPSGEEGERVERHRTKTTEFLRATGELTRVPVQQKTGRNVSVPMHQAYTKDSHPTLSLEGKSNGNLNLGLDWNGSNPGGVEFPIFDSLHGSLVQERKTGGFFHFNLLRTSFGTNNHAQ